MNFIKVQKRQSKTVAIQIYDSKISSFEMNGEVALIRHFNDGFDSGLEFVCRYNDNEEEISLKTKDIVLTQLANIPGYTITGEKNKQLVNKDLTTTDYKATVNDVDITFQIWLLKGEQNTTIDFEFHLEDNRLFVIEFTKDTLNDLINKSQSVMF